jgi:hypothetical protein
LPRAETAKPDKPDRFIEEQDFSIATIKLAGLGLLLKTHKARSGAMVEPLFEIKIEPLCSIGAGIEHR